MSTKRREVRKIIQSILDEYGVLCTIAREKPLCDAIADAVIEEMKPKRKPRIAAQAKSAVLHGIARAIAEVCIIDYEANKGQMFAEAKQLSRATPTPTPALIERHYGAGGTWYTKSYVGKTFGDAPTPGQVRRTWAKLVGGVKPQNTPQALGLDAPSPVPML